MNRGGSAGAPYELTVVSLLVVGVLAVVGGIMVARSGPELGFPDAILGSGHKSTRATSDASESTRGTHRSQPTRSDPRRVVAQDVRPIGRAVDVPAPQRAVRRARVVRRSASTPRPLPARRGDRPAKRGSAPSRAPDRPSSTPRKPAAQGAG